MRFFDVQLRLSWEKTSGAFLFAAVILIMLIAIICKAGIVLCFSNETNGKNNILRRENRITRKNPTIIKKYPIGEAGKIVNNKWGRLHF